MPRIEMITLCQRTWIYIFFLRIIQNKYLSIRWWKILLSFIFPTGRKIEHLYSIRPHCQPHHTPTRARTNCKLVLLLRPEGFNIRAGYIIIISHTHSYKIILVRPAGWVNFSVLWGFIFYDCPTGFRLLSL